MPITGNNLEIATVIFTASTSITDTATVSYSTSSAGIFSNPDGEKLADSSGGTLDAQPGSVMVAEGATILGTMLLQGRTNHTGTVVSVLPDSNLQATTNTGGAFSRSGLIPGGPDGVAGYLTAKQTGYEPSAGSNTLTSITLLLGGDATHDQTINIQDLAAIGSVFGQTGVTSCANLNGDVSGTVNILDLSLAASNYDQTGPTVWP